MSLPLCSTPDQLECTHNIKVKYEECLPKCSGVWLTSFDKKDQLDRKKTKLSEQYWNYKGYYNFPKYFSDNIPNPLYGQGNSSIA